MIIEVNGKKIELTMQDISILDFIKSKDLNPEHVVVEYNGNVVDQQEWHCITMQENDRLEVLRFVGGG